MKTRRLHRALLCLLTLCVVLAALPMCAAAEEIDSGEWGSLSWTLDDQGALNISVTAANVSATAMQSFQEGSTDAWLAHRDEIRSVTIGDRITSVSGYAFAGCTQLTEVNFCDSLQNIYQNAFKDCTALESVTIPGSASIWANAFTGCTALKTIVQETVDSAAPVIKSSAFKGCTALTHVTLSDKVTSIGTDAFADCKATLESINIPSGMADSNTGSNIKMAPNLFENCVKLTTVTIPAGVQISKSAFAGCTGLTSVTLGGGSQNIGELAFSGCTGLQNLAIPQGCYPSKGSFSGCTGLKTLSIADGLERVNQEAFKDCTALTTLELPASVTSVYKNAFLGCDALQTVRYGGTEEQWNKITILEGNDALKNARVITEHEHTYENGFCTVSGCEEPYQAATKNANGVYEIANGGQLYWFAQLTQEETAANAILTDNITVNGKVLEEDGTLVENTAGLRIWTPIGSEDTTYKGTFDGNGKTISGLYFQDATADEIGLIRSADGTVKNVTLTDSYFCGAEKVGGIVAYLYGGTITGCTNQATIVAEGKSGGGIVGRNYGGTVENCSNSGFVSGSMYIGGIAGENYNNGETPLIKNCTNSGAVTCTAVLSKVTETYVGGMAGRNYQGNVEDCVNTATVTNAANGKYTGGVAGQNDGGTVKNCTNSADVCGYATVGGILGYTSGAVENCHNSGKVSATSCAGGIAGEARSVAMSRCSNLGAVTCTGSSGQAGGLVGLVGKKTQTPTITDCYNAATVTGEKEVGGVAGHGEYAQMRNVLNVGTVNGNGKRVGALVGWETGKGGSFQNCYYLEGCATDGEQEVLSALGSTTVGTAETDGNGVNVETAVVLASGEITYLLNGSKSDESVIWKQTLDQDLYPNFTGKTVRYGYLSCREDAVAQYTNNPHATAQPDHIDENKDDICDICGTELEKPAGNVIRLEGENRHETSIKVANEMKEVLGVEKFDAIIVAYGYEYYDALAGSYLSAAKSAPILLSYGGDLERYAYLDTDNIDYIKVNLAENGTVYILGGESAVPTLYEDELAGYTVTRLGGDNRFETNLMILNEVGVEPGSEVLVCTATNFADCLSAAATGKPILLVWNERGTLYGNQATFLNGLKDCTFTIIGGEEAVSDKFVAVLESYGEVSRVEGGDRLGTSVAVAERYFENPTEAVLAYGWEFPDGLCGGALAYAMKSPLLLTHSGYVTTTAAYTSENGITSGIVLGGEGNVTDTAVREIFTMDADATITTK